MASAEKSLLLVARSLKGLTLFVVIFLELKKSYFFLSGRALNLPLS